MTTRRQFIGIGAALGLGATMRWSIDSKAGTLFKISRALAASGQTPLPASSIAQFVTPLPTFNSRRVSGASLTVGMQEFQQNILPDKFYGGLSGIYKQGTYVWGYQVGGNAPSYPGPTVVAQRDVPTTVTYVNNLPLKPVLYNNLTVDQTIHWADPLGLHTTLTAASKPSRFSGPMPGVAHLHGAEVLSDYDGAPDAWWTADGRRGKGYRSLTTAPANAAIYQYPNTQPATTLWFHDHALGTTRINVLSGLAAFYFVRDKFDTGQADNPLGLPAGNQEIELVLQDRQFDTNGQLYFPDGTETDPTTVLNGDPTNPGIHPTWIPEFFGDTIVVNGRTWPYLEVEPRRYRFRIVNGSNARFFRMNLADSTSGAAGPTIWQIGSDGGLFDRPVKPTDHENLKRLALFLAPGERADIIVDFSASAGKSFTLMNDAQFPYPSGGPVTTGLDDRVMQFRVTKRLSSRDTSMDPSAPGATLRGGANQPPAIVRLSNPTTGKLGTGVKADVVRQLVLVEVEGSGGPIEVLLNNTKWDGLREGTSQVAGGAGAQQNAAGDFVTELPRVGATEVWEIMNLTQDAHPIHLHLIQFQLLNRQQIQTNILPDGSADYVYRATYDKQFPGSRAGDTFMGQDANGNWVVTNYAPGTYIPGYGPPNSYTTPNGDGAIGGNPQFSPTLVGPTIVPEASEVGWKDTIKVYPGYVTRIVARWTPEETAIGTAGPGTNKFAFDPTLGPGYVWHCHILDHEDNEMMRPLKLTN